MVYNDILKYKDKYLNYYNTTSGNKNYDSCVNYTGGDIDSRLLKVKNLEERYQALLMTCSDYYLNIKKLKKEFLKINLKYDNNYEDAGCFISNFKIRNHIYTNPRIVINPNTYKEIEILETLIHEFRHYIIQMNNCCKQLDTDTILIRKGLSLLKYNIKTKELEKMGRGINELYNSYISMILLNNVLSMKKEDIKSKKFKEYLNTLNLNDKRRFYYTNSYNLLIKLTYPLLQCNEYTKYANDAAYLGDLDILIRPFNNEFKHIMTYDDLYKELDYLNDLEKIDDTKRILDYKKSMEEINYTYNLNRKR